MNRLISIVVVVLISNSFLYSQIIDKDTSDVVIRKTKKEKPDEYNISDVIIKKDKEKTKNIIRVDLDVPVKTVLRLSISDTAGATIMYLISDQAFSLGIYRVRFANLKLTILFLRGIFI